MPVDNYLVFYLPDERTCTVSIVRIMYNVYLYGVIPLAMNDFDEDSYNILPDIPTLNVHILEENWDAYEEGRGLYENINWIKWDGSHEHSWSEGIITKPVTATENGVRTYTCTICGETRTETIPATGVIGDDKNPGKDETDKPSQPALSMGASITDAATGAEYKVTASGAVEYSRPLNVSSKSVTVPKEVKLNGATYKVTSIAAGAFKGNQKLAKITIGDHVNTIASNAFSGCKKLKTVAGGKNVTAIGAKAFYKCTSLAKITIPAKVTSIGKQAFYGCKKLKNIVIKTNKLTAKKVGAKAFKGIHARAAIKVPKAKKKEYKKLLKAKGVGRKVKIK